jgi:hypothetical protein
MPSLQTLHVDQALTQISVAYRNAAFVSEEVFPVVSVKKRSDVYFKFSKQHFRTYIDAYEAGQRAHQIEIDLDARGFYFCDGHAEEVSITDDERENADPGAQLEVEKTEKLTNTIALNQENNFFTNIITSSNITQNATLSGTSQWSDYTNSDPVTEILAQRRTVQQQIGEFPNSLLLSQPVFDVLRNHPRIIDRLKYTGSGARAQLDTSDLARVFELDNVLVSAAIKQSVNEGQADSTTYIMGKNALLYFRPARPGLRTPSLGYTFVWTARSGVLRWRQADLESDFIRVKKYYDQRIVDAKAGYLWLNAVA